MGKSVWPDTKRKTKQQRKFREHDVATIQAESRWQCETCPDVIASNDDIYCIHCKMYWNGQFAE